VVEHPTADRAVPGSNPGAPCVGTERFQRRIQNYTFCCLQLPSLYHNKAELSLSVRMRASLTAHHQIREKNLIFYQRKEINV
jgi:hypothetical protein